jgi:hypothetical protein
VAADDQLGRVELGGARGQHGAALEAGVVGDQQAATHGPESIGHCRCVAEQRPNSVAHAPSTAPDGPACVRHGSSVAHRGLVSADAHAAAVGLDAATAQHLEQLLRLGAGGGTPAGGAGVGT